MSTVQEHSTDSSTKFPRKPEAYHPSRDFVKAKKNRGIHGWIIREVIENGRLLDDPQDGVMQFRRVIQGQTGCYEWKFVVAYNENGPNTLITGYVPEFPNDKTTQDLRYKQEF